VRRRRLTMAALPGPPSLTITMTCDFLSAVHHRSIMHSRLSWVPACSELGDRARVLPIEIEGRGISTLVATVVAHSLGGWFMQGGGVGRRGGLIYLAKPD
jgi:hypothetical protein